MQLAGFVPVREKSGRIKMSQGKVREYKNKSGKSGKNIKIWKSQGYNLALRSVCLAIVEVSKTNS